MIAGFERVGFKGPYSVITIFSELRPNVLNIVYKFFQDTKINI